MLGKVVPPLTMRGLRAVSMGLLVQASRRGLGIKISKLDIKNKEARIDIMDPFGNNLFS